MNANKKMNCLVIVVIYAGSLDECRTLRCLQELSVGHRQQMHLYVHINGTSDLRQELQEQFQGTFGRLSVSYDGKNRGIVYAYKTAVIACGSSVQWITLLDQDSVFDNRLFDAIEAAVPSLSANEVMLAPVVRENKSGAQVSPFRVFLGKAIPFRSVIGFPVCINSMTTFRSEYLVKLAPYFQIDFFLDTFDCWLSHSMHCQGLKVKVLQDVVTGHELSLAESDHGDIYRAREIMALFNATRISWKFFPLAAVRFFWRLSCVSWQDKTIRYFNLFEHYRKYKKLKEELYD